MDLSLEKYRVIRVITNKYNIFWGVLYSAFWILLSAFVFSIQLPKGSSPQVYLYFSGGWFSFIAVYLPTAISVGVLTTMVYQTGSIPYLIRFGKLSASRYIISNYLAMLIPSIVFSLISLVLTIIAYFMKYNIILMPYNIGLVFLSIILTSLFVISLDFLLYTIMAKFLGFKQANFISFLPMMLMFALFFSNLYISFPKALLYISPINACLDLTLYSYSGQEPSTTLAFPGSETVSPLLDAISITAWIVILTAISMPLVSRIYYRPEEEIRQM